MSAQAWNAQQHLAARYVAAMEVEKAWAEKLEDAHRRGDAFEMRVACYWHALAAMDRARIARDYYYAATGKKPPQGAHR